ncbi:MAG: hypothetical protein HY958_07420 [Bacteroidia bacterium]|nr:hypothetical protein [Bacteroidia bacterium]
MHIKNIYIYILILTGTASLFYRCNSDKSIDDKDNIVFNDKFIKDSADINKVRVIFYNVPSPVEMTTIIQNAGVTYNPELLNPIKNTEKYLTSAKTAMNLGVYGADLSYVRIFDQIQESVKYLAVIKRFSEKLGIPGDKGSFTVGRLEDNVNNRDSVLRIISETYANADVYLKENNRGSTAALIILGGWVEALNIATSIVDEKNPSSEIMKRIAEQKYSLNNLIELVTAYKSDETVLLYIPKLHELKACYEKIKLTPSGIETSTDKKNKVTTLDSKSSVQISLDDIKAINKIVIEIRKEMIK